MTVLQIETPKNFAFEATVVSHGWYLLAPFHWDRKKGVLHRVEDLNGVAAQLRITHRDRHLLVSSRSDLRPHAALLRKRLERTFQLTMDTSDFLTLCRKSDSHGSVARARFGRLLCGSTLFEDAVKVITTTNTTWRQTMRMVALLTETFGRRSPEGAPAFPTAEAIAASTPDELREVCRLGYRAVTIHALARGVIDGSIDLADITDPSQTSEELYGRFQELPGIGPYGAAHLLAMDGRHDFIAVDTEFRRFVRERHFRGRKVSDRTMVRRYKQWGRWQYLAYWSELWMSISRDLEEFEKTAE
jgi:3-methyladenine DNA glycosylase/8-oxoguanine DNA glycosylase